MEKCDFFQNVAAYLENRVKMVDDKSNIFLAINLGLLIGLGYIIKEFFFTMSGYIFLSAHTIFSIFLFALFLQAVRPAHYFLGLFAHPDPLGCENYIFWPENNPDLIQKLKNNDLSKTQFKLLFKNFSDQDIFNNYQELIHAQLNIINSKYKYYRVAVLLLKCLLLFDITAILLLAVFNASFF